MSCEYEHPDERLVGWIGEHPITFKECLCWGQKNAPACPYFLADDQNEQKNCPRYKEKVNE